MPTNIFGVVDLIESVPRPREPVQLQPRDRLRAPGGGNRRHRRRQLLPSISVVYQAAPNMNLRATWSRTIARPTFRELAPVATEEFIHGDEFVGNPEIVLSEITNYDLRWEWFRRPGEVFAASLFYKDLQNPIELISFSTNNRSFIQPVNFEAGRCSEPSSRLVWTWATTSGRCRGWLSAHYTLLDSEVEVPLREQISLQPYGLDEETRRLQGQPDNLANST